MPNGPEARGAARKKVTRSGVIVYADDAGTMACTIADISESGARLLFRASHKPPMRFYLIDLQDRMAFDGLVAWQNSSQCGIRFLARHPLAKLPRELRFLQSAWLEAARR
jgi:hypothetical protein